MEKAVSQFEAIYNEQVDTNRNVEALMGRCKANEILKRFDVSLNTINEVNIVYPEFKAGFLEKSKLLMTVDDWEQLQDYCSRILYDDEKNILALMLYTFYTFAREGDISTGCERLLKLISSIE